MAINVFENIHLFFIYNPILYLPLWDEFCIHFFLLCKFNLFNRKKEKKITSRRFETNNISVIYNAYNKRALVTLYYVICESIALFDKLLHADHVHRSLHRYCGNIKDLIFSLVIKLGHILENIELKWKSLRVHKSCMIKYLIRSKCRFLINLCRRCPVSSKCNFKK